MILSQKKFKFNLSIMRLVLLLSFIFAINLSVFAQKEAVYPLNKKKSVKIISGKSTDYYTLDTEKTTDFQVELFDKIIIYSREQIDKNSIGYNLSYRFDTTDFTHSKKIKKGKDVNSVLIATDIGKKNVSYYYKTQLIVPEGVKLLQLKSNFEKVAVKVKAYKNRKKVFLQPLSNSKKVRVTKGKRRRYYKLNSKKPTVLETNKEGELIVYTRKRISAKSSNNYSFSYQVGDSIPVKVRINNVKKSMYAAYSSTKINKTPSSYNKTIIKVKDVYQQIKFSSKYPVDARFVFIRELKKNGWEEIQTKGGIRIPLVVKKKKVVRDYTRIENKQPFVFETNKKSDTKLRVFIRGEFRYDMHANNDYEVILRDYNKVVHTYKLTCNRSNIMNYKNNDNLIPGTLDKFELIVPKGKHAYSISIANKRKSALVRVLLENE